MISIIRLVTVIVFITALPHLVSSQSLSINTDGSTANASAMLDVKSVNKGLLIPRMSRTERDAISAPATGLLIFQNAPDSIGFYYYNGSNWAWLLSNSNVNSLAWRTGGNAGTNAANDFIGTTDNVPLVFRSNNAEKMRLTPNGELGLGTTTPNSTYGFAKLELASEGLLAPTDLLIRNAVNDAGYAPGIVFQHARGTLASPLSITNGDYLGSPVSSLNYDGSSYVLSAAIDLFTDGPVSTNKVATRFNFNTRDTSGSYQNRMVIKSNGLVGIGVAAPTTYLDVTGALGGTNSLQLRSGNQSATFLSNQLLLAYNGTTNFRHAIKTRHHSGIPGQNSIDFFLWSQGVDAAGTIGTKQVMTIDGEWKGMVGIGTPTPRSELHITDGSASLKGVNDGGGFGASVLITDNIIPRIYFEAAAEPADKKMMALTLLGQNLSFGSLNDAASAWDKQHILVANRNGNVGIGVPVPQVALDVAGSGTFGVGNTNSGTRSIVAGNSNNLSGNYSIANGEANTLSAIRSTVTGLGNVVAGENNVVGGYQNHIPPFIANSIVVGIQDTLTASASAIFGYLNKVTAFAGFAAGDRNLVSGVKATAFGFEGMASGVNAFTTGSQDTARGDNAAVFGTGNHGASYCEMALGTYGTLYTPLSVFNFNPADRIFNIGNGVSGNSRADAFTVLKSGNVGIGTNAPTALLSVNGTANNSTGSWGVFSDARIKTVTGEFTDGLNIIRQINPVKYNYNKDAPLKTTSLQIGIVAQDLEKIAPYMVTARNYKGFTDLREVNNQAYVFLLINAVKQQQLQIEDQQKESAAEKNRNAALEKRVDALEKAIKEIKGTMK